MSANYTKSTHPGSNRLSLFADGTKVFTQIVSEKGTHVDSQGDLQLTAKDQLRLTSNDITVDVEEIAASIQRSKDNKTSIIDQNAACSESHKNLNDAIGDIAKQHTEDMKAIDEAQNLQDAATKTLEDAFNAFKAGEVEQILNQLNLLQQQFNALTGRGETKDEPQKADEPNKAEEPNKVEEPNKAEEPNTAVE